MVQGTQATDTFLKYCQMDGESSNRNIPSPNHSNLSEVFYSHSFFLAFMMQHIL